MLKDDSWQYKQDGFVWNSDSQIREEGLFSKNKTPIPKFWYTALEKHASPLKIKASIEVNVLCNK